MISRQTKPLSLLQKTITPPTIRLNKCYWLLYKGYEPHYQWFAKNASLIDRDWDVYCVDKAAIDLTLEMAERNTTTLSYVHTRHYETITAVAKTYHSEKIQKVNSIAQNKNSEFKHSISIQTSRKALDFLHNYKFVIKTAYLDVHPLITYEKMCGYLMIKPEQKINKLFEQSKVTTQTLFNSFSTIKFLSEIRTRFLQTQLFKLKKLQRRDITPPTSQVINSYLKQWSKLTLFQTFANASSSFKQEDKIKWISQQQLGQIIKIEDVLKNKYRNYYYAQWV